jgi:hypothetical protein
VPRVVNFFIVGVQKGGTSALDAYLGSSQHVQMANVKETHFFDNDNIDWSRPDYRPLLNRFSWTATAPACRGEATPIYSYWPNALERLQRHNPRARLIVCLRQPAYRAHSHWRMERQRGWEPLSFEQAISDIGRRRVRESEDRYYRLFSYVERGFYSRQISRIQRLFPPDQLLFLRTDELWHDPMRVMYRVHAFLGVPPPDAVERDYVTPSDTSGWGDIPERALLTLNAVYADDIKATSELIGSDLDDWLSPDYRDVRELALTGPIAGSGRKDARTPAKQRQLVPKLSPA